MIKKISPIFIFFFSLSQIKAQYNDAQLWENINVEKNITPKLLARINQEGRVTENLTIPSFNYFDIGLCYKVNKHIHITLAYVWEVKRQFDESWSTRHQAYLDVTLRKKIKSFMFTDRQMLMWQVKDYFTSQYGKIPDYYLRNKFTIKYEKFFKIVPYLAEETYFLTSGPNDGTRDSFNRMRYFAGILYHPNLINEFEVYYLIEHQFNIVNPPTNWVIGLGYTHTF